MRFKKSFAVGIVLLAVVVISCGFVVAGGIVGKVVGEFDSDNVFLKIGVVEGGQSVKNVKISNSNHGNHFSVNAEGLENIVSFDEREFDLGVDEVKDIKVYFNAGNNEPGVYIGKLNIISEKDFKEIPIILEIQSKDILFDSNIRLFPYGSDIVSGDKLDVEIGVFDLVNRGISDINADYFIKDFNGRTIISESENLIVDSKLDYSKSFKLPVNMGVGGYVFGITLKHGDSVGTSSIYFEIAESEKPSVVGDFSYIFIILLIGIFLAVIMFFSFYFMNRNNLIGEVRRAYKRELKLEKELYREKLNQEYALKGNVRKVYRGEVKKVERQRAKILKNSYKTKLKEVKKLKKKGKGVNYKSLVKKWKLQGYGTKVLERKYKYPRVEEIKKKISMWKKKGYNTGVLEKR